MFFLHLFRVSFNKQLENIIYLGICFLVFMMSSSAIINLQRVMLASISEEGKAFNGNGYAGLAINYFCVAASTWLTPSILAYVGIKNALLIGVCGDVLYGLSFYMENAATFYTFSAVTGLTHSLLWTSQGAYLIENSTSETINRDSLIFYFFYHIATPLGNGIAFFRLNGKSRIDSNTRTSLLHCLNSFAVLSVIMFFFIEPVKKDKKLEESKNEGLDALKKAWRVFTNKDMVILIHIFIYTGFQVAFTETIYNSSVGFTLSLAKNVKQLVPLAGVFSGLGTVLGAGFQIMFKFMPCKWEKSISMSFGIVCQILSYFLSFLNLPDESAFGDNYGNGTFLNSVSVAMLTSVLLNIGDICIQTYVSSLLYDMFRKESEAVSAVSSFTECAATAVCFSYSTQIGLHYQLVLLITAGMFGLASFLYVDQNVIKQKLRFKPKDLEMCQI